MLKKIATSLRRYSSIKFSTLTQKVQVKCMAMKYFDATAAIAKIEKLQ